MKRPYVWTLVCLLLACGPAPKLPAGKPVAVDYATERPVPFPSLGKVAPMFRGATYDDAVPTPDQCLGYPLGSRMAAAEAIVGCFRKWAEASPRATIERYAQSYEGRELVRVVITSPDNLARLDAILADLGKLSNPRGLSAAEATRIATTTPAVGWFGYSIHGDETSGADASLAFGHYLIAGTDARARKILDNTVVVIDPMMNPDGRTRFLSMVDQARSEAVSLNHESMHRGYWPAGRGNHYLFDMNRDWIVGSQPETRGRWANFRKFHPQLFVDVHEMGALDTYLFSPKGQPVNPNFARSAPRWNKLFADDQGKAFDAYGWPYYTREWSGNWYPGYSSTWGPLQGAIGILHEQAGIAGIPLRRRSGEVITYRDTVHHQAVGSLANATSLADNKQAVLRDYLAYHRESLNPPGRARTFVIRPGAAPDRERELVGALLGQGIEVHVANAAFSAVNAESVMREKKARDSFPQGSFLVDAAQPKGALARALLEFDPRIAQKDLDDERTDLVRTGRGGIYDVTAWNLGMAFAVDAHWIDTPRAARTQLTAPPTASSGVVAGQGSPVAWGVRVNDDASLAFAGRIADLGVQVYVVDKTFHAAGQTFERGSFLVRRVENPANVAETLQAVAKLTGVQVFAIASARSATDGPDLGGQHFTLLSRPRIAILTNTPVSPSDYGHIWHWLDRHLGVPVTLIDVQQMGSYDFRRYNVIIVPPMSSGGGPVAAYGAALKNWVRSGGTLVAIGSGARIVAAGSLGLTRVRRRRDVLGQLPLYDAPTQRWLAGRSVDVDVSSVWDGQTVPAPSPAVRALMKSAEPLTGPAADQAREAEDAWLRRFSPSGAVLRGLADDDHWLTFGIGAELPVLAQGDLALIPPESARVPVRLATQDRLRLAGLLWPEARARLATTAWLTAERAGAGQIILFAGRPGFRAQQRGTARLLSNAVILGPAMGARQPLKW